MISNRETTIELSEQGEQQILDDYDREADCWNGDTGCWPDF